MSGEASVRSEALIPKLLPGWSAATYVSAVGVNVSVVGGGGGPPGAKVAV